MHAAAPRAAERRTSDPLPPPPPPHLASRTVPLSGNPTEGARTRATGRRRSIPLEDVRGATDARLFASKTDQRRRPNDRPDTLSVSPSTSTSAPTPRPFFFLSPFSLSSAAVFISESSSPTPTDRRGSLGVCRTRSIGRLEAGAHGHNAVLPPSPRLSRRLPPLLPLLPPSRPVTPAANRHQAARRAPRSVRLGYFESEKAASQIAEARFDGRRSGMGERAPMCVSGARGACRGGGAAIAGGGWRRSAARRLGADGGANVRSAGREHADLSEPSGPKLPHVRRSARGLAGGKEAASRPGVGPRPPARGPPARGRGGRGWEGRGPRVLTCHPDRRRPESPPCVFSR